MRMAILKLQAKRRKKKITDNMKRKAESIGITVAFHGKVGVSQNPEPLRGINFNQYYLGVTINTDNC